MSFDDDLYEALVRWQEPMGKFENLPASVVEGRRVPSDRFCTELCETIPYGLNHRAVLPRLKVVPDQGLPALGEIPAVGKYKSLYNRS
jgi:hypothetical protein